MSSHLLRSRRHHDGCGDQANGSATVSLSDMIKRAHGTVRTSIAFILAADIARRRGTRCRLPARRTATAVASTPLPPRIVTRIKDEPPGQDSGRPVPAVRELNADDRLGLSGQGRVGGTA